MESHRKVELGMFWDGRVEREVARETSEPRKRIHTDLLWREIHKVINAEQHMRILDAGAGTGRFSIPLARLGHQVVHLDISPGMLDCARRDAQGLDTIAFVQGSVDDLSRFPDGNFDLVLCLDSPLSFCFHAYETALGELVRVARRTLILCVMNRTGVITEGGINFDLEHYGRLKTVPPVYETGDLEVTEEMLSIRSTLLPSWHAFRPAEIRMLLEKNHCRVERLYAPGTLARFTDPELLCKLFENQEAYLNFLNFEESFDSEPDLLGVGAIGAGGLLVTATKCSLPTLP
jgi:SAM-dependent methyltransferase